MWGNILDRLQQQGFAISEADETTGELVVGYQGDPQPYVDCGWIVATIGSESSGGRRRRRRAATFIRRWQGRAGRVQRDLELDARMTVQVEPDGEARWCAPKASTG